MEVHVITSANQHLYSEALRQYHHERHRIYAEQLTWVPPSADRLEHDPFDTEHAVHFVGIEAGRVIAGSRLVPTHLPHLLSEVFPDVCTRPGGLIRDPAVAEWTRGFVTREAREGTNKRIIFQFCHAIMEYALQENITVLGGIQRTYWLSLWARMGWNVSIYGEPLLFDDEEWVPAYFDVSEQALKGARQWAKLDSSILVQDGPQKLFIAPEGRNVPVAAAGLPERPLVTHGAM